MRIILTLNGKSPLVMHNGLLANPLNKFTREISRISKKKTKTEDDYTEMAHFEFLGSLYIGEGGPVVPTANVKRCLQDAAQLSRAGKKVERALIPATQELRLDYKGPRTPEELWNDENFHFSTPVRVQRNRVMRMRPRFMPVWSLTGMWELLTDLLELDDLKRIVDEAGTIIGLGDHRPLGSGRFEADVGRA